MFCFKHNDLPLFAQYCKTFSYFLKYEIILMYLSLQIHGKTELVTSNKRPVPLTWHFSKKYSLQPLLDGKGKKMNRYHTRQSILKDKDVVLMPMSFCVPFQKCIFQSGPNFFLETCRTLKSNSFLILRTKIKQVHMDLMSHGTWVFLSHWNSYLKMGAALQLSFSSIHTGNCGCLTPKTQHLQRVSSIM